MNSDHKLLDREKQPVPPKPAIEPAEQLSHNAQVEEFFRRLKSDLRRPKPGEDAVAAALQAIQRLAQQVENEQAGETAVTDTEAASAAGICLVCGRQNPAEHSFCGKCGAPLQPSPDREEQAAKTSTPGPLAGQHHYHHHYHHHYFPAGYEADSQPSAFHAPAPAKESTRVRAPLQGPAISRTEAAVRKLTQEWSLACNTRQLDDLVGFYSPDALVLRSNFPPVRGAAAIREFFCAALDAGLGEVELEPLRVEIFADIAYEAGRCKMLVPIAVGKRREERGKYLVIFNRQPDGEWKAVADCWSSDLGLQVAAEPETAKSGNAIAANPVSRVPRRSA